MKIKLKPWQMKVIMTTLGVVIGLLIVAIIACLIGGLLQTSHRVPVKVGTVSLNSAGKLELVGQCDRPTRLPMWVLNYPDGKPNWGYILLDDSALNSVETVKYIEKDLGYSRVILGNYADSQYADGFPPIYNGTNGFWDPTSREVFKFEPKKFMFVVWLDRRDGPVEYDFAK